jgi:hypothetical protein
MGFKGVDSTAARRDFLIHKYSVKMGMMVPDSVF